MKPRDPMDTLKRAFPGMTWTQTASSGVKRAYEGKRKGLALKFAQYCGERWTVALCVNGWDVWEVEDWRLPRLCARTADRLWRIANACEAAQVLQPVKRKPAPEF